MLEKVDLRNINLSRRDPLFTGFGPVYPISPVFVNVSEGRENEDPCRDLNLYSSVNK